MACLENVGRALSDRSSESLSTEGTRRLLRACNLGDRIVKELDFLTCVDRLGDVLYAPEVVKLSILRYEHLWLPVCQNALEALNPPLDIAFIQHCHLLSPTRCVPSLAFGGLPRPVNACALLFLLGNSWWINFVFQVPQTRLLSILRGILSCNRRGRRDNHLSSSAESRAVLQILGPSGVDYRRPKGFEQSQRTAWGPGYQPTLHSSILPLTFNQILSNFQVNASAICVQIMPPNAHM